MNKNKRKVTKVIFNYGRPDIIFDRSLKDFMKFIKNKDWIPFNNKMINKKQILYVEEINY